MISILDHTRKHSCLALFAVLAVSGCAGTQDAPTASEIVKQEPAAGMLAGGKIAYVDDGTCPKGEVKAVRGGAISDLGLRTSVWCVKRPQ